MSDAMAEQELSELLNQPLSAERAGSRLLAASLDDRPAQSPFFEPLQIVQRDEARNCALLINCLVDIDAVPTWRTGEFYTKGLALYDWPARLELLNRGQAWVARRIAAALPRIQAPKARMVLQQMHDSHFANIERWKKLLG